MHRPFAILVLTLLMGGAAAAQQGTPSPAVRGPSDPGATSSPGQSNATGCDRTVAVAPGADGKSDRTGTTEGCEPRQTSHPVPPGEGTGAARR